MMVEFTLKLYCWVDLKNIICLLLIFECLSISDLYAQVSQDQVDQYLADIDYYLNRNLDSSFYFARELEDRVADSGHQPWIEQASYQLGICYRLDGEYDEARTRFERYLNYAQANDLVNEQGLALYQLAYEVTNQKATEEYLALINRSINLFKQAGNLTMVSSALVNKATHLRNERLFDPAKEALDEAWANSQEIGDRSLSSVVLNSQGVLLAAQGQFNESITYFEQDVALNRLRSDPTALAGALGNLGFAHLRNNEISKGEEYIKEALEYRKEIGRPYEIAMGLIQIAEVNVLQNKWSKALQYSQEAQKIATDKNLKFVREQCHRQLSYIYQNMNKYEEALGQFKKYHFLKDSILNEKINENAQKVEAAYQVAEKEKEILQLEYEDEIQANKLYQQKIALGGAALGLGVLSFLLFRLFGQNKKITTQNELITKANAEKEVLLKEIHHRVKNNLQVISSLLGLQSLSIKDQAAKDAIQEGRSRVHSMSLIHQSLYKKDNLTGIEMEPYVQKLCKDLINTYQVGDTKITFHEEVQSGLMLDVETVVPLGLIINELVTNSLKYAFSDREKGLITVALSEGDGQLKLTVADNGVGMDAASLESKQDSFGHSLIRAFKDKLDAEISMSGEDGVKVTLLIENYKRIHL